MKRFRSFSSNLQIDQFQVVNASMNSRRLPYSSRNMGESSAPKICKIVAKHQKFATGI